MEIPPDLPDPCDLLPRCPVCKGKMELVYDRRHLKVCVCADCFTGVYIPVEALVLARDRQADR